MPVALGSRAGAVPGALGVASTAAGGAQAPAAPATPESGDDEAAGAPATSLGGEGAAAGNGVAAPRVKAAAVLLADEQTGQVLFAQNAEQQRAMASTTKVMTALLALEHLDERRAVVIGTEPTTVGEESLELRKGERFTVHQLLVGLLVKSANDAAVALADAVDGSEAVFVRRMNARAAELGLRDTHYVTPYGLDRPGHRTSARDLARLWEAAMRRADFRALVSTRHAQVPGPPRVRRFTNTNQLLGSYAWAVGGKTGFTGAAGRCLVASASRGGRRLVAVALGSPDAFADVRALFEYGFTAFDWVRLAQRGQAVTLAGTAGQTAAYHVTADVDVLVRRDLLDELTVASPSRLVAVPNAPPAAASAAAGAISTVWIQAGGQRLAPLRLGVQGDASATGTVRAIPPMSSVVPGLVPPGSVPAAIDPFLRRAEP
jgi:D-alanyl-D-alanine carboxypeptidase (penicillin-binding protein 5/6)